MSKATISARDRQKLESLAEWVQGRAQVHLGCSRSPELSKWRRERDWGTTDGWMREPLRSDARWPRWTGRGNELRRDMLPDLQGQRVRQPMRLQEEVFLPEEPSVMRIVPCEEAVASTVQYHGVRYLGEHADSDARYVDVGHGVTSFWSQSRMPALLPT